MWGSESGGSSGSWIERLGISIDLAAGIKIKLVQLLLYHCANPYTQES